MKDDSKAKRTALSGPEKAAIFLALVGEELATALAGELQEKELIMLRQGVHRMAQIEPDHIDEVFEEACKQLKKANILPEETNEYLERVITKAMGPEKANAILGRIFQEDTDETYVIDVLHEMDGKTLAQFLQEEHPQTVAISLAHRKTAHAGEECSI